MSSHLPVRFSRSLSRFFAALQSRPVRRGTLALLLAGSTSLTLSLAMARRQNASATSRLNSAAARMEVLTDAPADDNRRAAIIWGYGERLRLGLESPFRLIEAAGRDPRLTNDERHTVAWALLAHVLRGETHEMDAAALDGLGPVVAGRSVPGEQHLRLIENAIGRAEDPRAAELAVRLAYALAVAERIVDGSAPVITAEAAALVADRELSRREAHDVLRSARGADPLEVVRRRRARRSFYVERPALLTPSEDMERSAIEMVPRLLQTLRTMQVEGSLDSTPGLDGNVATHAPRLFAAGTRVPPVAPLAVTVRRYLPMIRAQAPRVDRDALSRTQNTEMLVAVTRVAPAGRQQRRAIGRLLLATGTSMRSLAQEPVWFPGDTGWSSATQGAASIGVAEIVFDRDVPVEWRPYFLRSFAHAVRDLRRVLPGANLSALRVRFRMTTPADSALAMHDPRTRTLHLPIPTAGGALSHELAHDIDRQSAQQQGLAGYRSDIVARQDSRGTPSRGANGRLAASLRALTEELAEVPPATRATAERPAEIFATRVDWFVAVSLARVGISSGFLSGVQDELLTGHVVHPERLRTSGRSRSLLNALQEMTQVAPFAAEDHEPSVQTLLRWSLAGPVDRRVAGDIVRGEPRPWMPVRLLGEGSCDDDATDRAMLIRLAAESRARGWMRLRARWLRDADRPAWARSLAGVGPWSDAPAERRVAQLRDYILVELSSGAALPSGLGAYAPPLAARALCRQ